MSIRIKLFLKQSLMLMFVVKDLLGIVLLTIQTNKLSKRIKLDKFAILSIMIKKFWMNRLLIYNLE